MNAKKPFSLVIITLVLALFCSYHIYYHFTDIANENLVKDYYEIKKEESDSLNKVKKTNINNSEYLGILTIPKINLKTGFYNTDSEKNNVSNNVTLLKESIMPPNNGSIIYLAAHSGSGYLAYFKDLDKLMVEDMITITYDKNDYQYMVNSIYETPKNGEIIVNHNINEKYLVLTTCSKNENMQLVILAKMLNRA